jgi:hypothetical protein
MDMDSKNNYNNARTQKEEGRRKGGIIAQTTSIASRLTTPYSFSVNTGNREAERRQEEKENRFWARVYKVSIHVALTAISSSSTIDGAH